MSKPIRVVMVTGISLANIKSAEGRVPACLNSSASLTTYTVYSKYLVPELASSDAWLAHH